MQTHNSLLLVLSTKMNVEVMAPLLCYQHPLTIFCSLNRQWPSLAWGSLKAKKTFSLVCLAVDLGRFPLSPLRESSLKD